MKGDIFFMFLFQKDIQKVLKENNIKEDRFHRVNICKWENIYSKAADKFADRSKIWRKGLHWANTNGYSQKQEFIFAYDSRDNWNFIYKLSEIILESHKMVYLFLEKGNDKFEIYEGYIPETIIILDEGIFLSDFYIVSKKYEWIIGYNHEEIVSFVGRGLNIECLKNKKED